ncbi:MAG: hypothetical protein FWG65_01290 [Turicibacter sp.]|nr:hypothetical protein [Turicibacter sp.]
MNLKTTNFRLSVGRALHFYRRYSVADSDQSKASAAYYACYHAAIAAVELKADFVLLKKAENTSYHEALRNVYPRHYGAPTKKNKTKPQIVPHDVGSSLEIWHNLRIKADYFVFDEQFDEKDINKTRQRIGHMENFVKDHLQYFADNFPQLLTEGQAAEIGGILHPRSLS